MEFERQSQELFEVSASGMAKVVPPPEPANDGEGFEDAQGGDASQAVKNIGHLISSIVTWEDKWGRMAKEHTTELPQLWKIAAFIELCPPEVQDMIYQTAAEVNENYEKVKQRVASWAANKSAANGPTPMDIGEVDGYRCE